MFLADPNLVEALFERSQPVACSESCTLFSQGDQATGLYILQSGEATLQMKSRSGATVLFRQIVAGSILGLPAVVGNSPYSLTATLRKGSRVSFVTRDDFVKTIEQHPELYPALLEFLAAEIRYVREAFAAR